MCILMRIIKCVYHRGKGWNGAERAVTGTGQPLVCSCSGHPCSPAATKTLAPTLSTFHQSRNTWIQAM